MMENDRGKGHNLFLRFFKKIWYFTPFDRMSGVRSVSGIRRTYLCRFLPLVGTERWWHTGKIRKYRSPKKSLGRTVWKGFLKTSWQCNRQERTERNVKKDWLDRSELQFHKRLDYLIVRAEYTEQVRRDIDDRKDPGQNSIDRKGRTGQQAAQERQEKQNRAKKTVGKNGQKINRMGI